MTICCETGSVFAGFTLKEYCKNKEIDADIYLFEHTILGCPLLAIKNSDSNKTFTAAFNTIPTDSTGVAHILEHSVLMGSKKYPVKDVFGEINKGGITTFLNAMTGADITYYPFATRNMKEYFDIMDVYCDVVFHPLLKRQTFEQEGWHYHQEEADQPLQIQGVVYNEMKGAFSDPVRHLFHHIFKGLLPGSTYAHESGGDPEVIPDLDYEEFCAFHKKHYHPSNAFFFLYGDAPLEKELEFLQTNFLAHYNEKGEKALIAEGHPTTTPLTIEDGYAVGTTDTADKTFLAVGTNVATILNRLEGMAFQVIANILYNSDASPLKNAIITSGVCKDFGGLYVTGNSFRTMMITYLIGSEPEHKDKFLTLYQKTLTELVEQGLDKELVLAELNKFEFGYREEGSKAQRGLSLIMRAMNGLKYGGKVMEWLESEKLIATLRHKAIEEGWFEELIKKHLLDNPATVTVVLTPDPDKQQIRTEEEKKRIAAYDAAASAAEKEQRITRTKELQKAQLTPNDEKTLALLPRLAINDLPVKIDYHQALAEEMFAGGSQKVLVNELATNHITYLDAGFDVAALSMEQLPFLDIFATIACEIGTKNLNFQQFAKKLATVTGSFSSSFSCYTRKDRPPLPMLWFHLKALPHYLPQAMELMADVFSSLSLVDKKRIREIVGREFTWHQHSVQSEGYSLASGRIFAHLSPSGRYNELVNGASSYLALKDLALNYDKKEESFLHMLADMAHRIFNQKNLQLAITAEEQEIRHFQERGTLIIDSLGKEAPATQPVSSLNLPTHEAFITAAEVVFAAQGGNLLEEGEGYNGSFDVLQTWLNRDYLWNTVRQMGGAYGCFSQFNPVSGNIAFISYRDPQVQKTYDAYNAIPAAIESLQLSENVLQQLITGTYGSLDPHQSAAIRGAAARNEYLGGITKEFKEQRLQEALTTTVASMRSFAPAFKEMTDTAHRAIIGNREKIEADGGLFDKFTEL